MIRPVRLILVLTGIIAAIPGVGWAQPAGWYLRPTLSVGERYESNIFGVANGETSDFITNFTGSLEGGYQSVPLTVIGAYSLTGEVYAENSELNNLGDNQSARLLVNYVPDPLWTLNLILRYERSAGPILFLRTPASAAPSGPAPPPGTTAPPSTGQAGISTPFVPAIDEGQAETAVITVSPSVSYLFDARTSITVGYDYTRSEVDNDITTEHAPHFSLGRQLTARDQGSLNYAFRLFEGEDEQGNSDTDTSHVITLGWVRQLTPIMTLRLAAGPNFSDEGGVGAELLAGIDYRFRTGAASLTYQRSQSVVVGLTGASDVDSVTANVVWTPCLRCSAGFSGSFGNFVPTNSNAGLGDRVYGAGISFSYGITQWVSARASYDFTYQDAIEEGVGSITNHTVSVNLDFSYLFRIR